MQSNRTKACWVHRFKDLITTFDVAIGAGGECEHRVGCFFHLEMRTWADALLALSVMQAAAIDVRHRWQSMSALDKKAATMPLRGLPTLRQAHTQDTPTHTMTRSTTSGRHRTSGERSRKQTGRGGTQASMDTDLAALKAAGVANATALDPPPIVIHEAGATPAVVCGGAALCATHETLMCVVVQRRSRVYRGTWDHNGATRDVVVKVVSRPQAAHEVRVLEAVSVHKEARAIQVLAQIPINGQDGDVGLVTPYCSGGHLFEGASSLNDVFRQAVQLCEVREQLLRCNAPNLPFTPRPLLLLLLLLVVVVGGGWWWCLWCTPGGDGVACRRRSTPGHQAGKRRHYQRRRRGGARRRYLEDCITRVGSCAWLCGYTRVHRAGAAW